jgi:hypothetical protein
MKWSGIVVLMLMGGCGAPYLVRAADLARAREQQADEVQARSIVDGQLAAVSVPTLVVAPQPPRRDGLVFVEAFKLRDLTPQGAPAPRDRRPLLITGGIIGSIGLVSTVAGAVWLGMIGPAPSCPDDNSALSSLAALGCELGPGLDHGLRVFGAGLLLGLGVAADVVGGILLLVGASR